MTELKLGRGLADLMDENVYEQDFDDKVVEIQISDIKPNPDQPRSVFDRGALNELADSIKEHGIIQPVILKPSGDKYTLVAGERRVRAAKIAGLESVPSIVREYNAIYLAELAILENLQREDLTPIEEAIAYNKLLTVMNLTHEDLAIKVGKSRTYVTNTVGLLNLPASIIDDVNSGKLSMGHARALSKIKDVTLCLQICERIYKENLSVRDVESLIRNLNKKEKIETISKEKVASTRKILDEIVYDSIKYKINKNKITFSYENEKELNEIITFLKRG